MDIDLVDDYLRHLKSSGKAATTLLAVGYWLRRLDRELPFGLYEADTEELEDWQSHRVSREDPEVICRKTQALTYSIITGFYTWISNPNRQVGLDYNPADTLVRPYVPPRRPRPVSTEQLVFARAHLRQPCRLYVELAAFAGLRAIEISRLDRDDVTKGELHVRRGKGDKERTILIGPELWVAVLALPPGPVARTVRGERRTSPQVYKLTNDALRAIGLEGVTMHRFRHWYGTYLVDEDAPLRAVQEAMGHASLDTTAGYIALTSRQRVKLSRAVNALPALAPAPN